MREGFELDSSDLGAQIVCLRAGKKRRLVINGFSVLGFCKAVQGLTGFSMRMAHA